MYKVNETSNSRSCLFNKLTRTGKVAMVSRGSNLLNIVFALSVVILSPSAYDVALAGGGSQELNTRVGPDPHQRNLINKARLRNINAPDDSVVIDYDRGLPSLYSPCGGVSVGNVAADRVGRVENEIIERNIIVKNYHINESAETAEKFV